MSISTNATIAQFAAAYAGALSSLGIECAPQALVSDGTIEYGSEATGPLDKPLINIDGSRSTHARSSYILLSAAKERIAVMSPKSGVDEIINVDPPFLSEIDRLEEILDSETISITHHFAGPDSEGYAIRRPRLRELLKTLSSHPIAFDFHENIKHIAYRIATDAHRTIRGDYTDAAGQFFVAGALLAGLGDEDSVKKAVEMFLESAGRFGMMNVYSISRPAVTELAATLVGKDETQSDSFLSMIADFWDDAAKALKIRGDVVGATIAIYRGLRAAALSKNYDAMRLLFAFSAEINGESENTEEQMRDYLRSAQAAFNTYIHGTNSDEHFIWEEAFWGLQSAFGLMNDQNMIDTIKPFLVAAKERAELNETVDPKATDADPIPVADYAIEVEMNKAIKELMMDQNIVPPSEIDDLIENWDEIVKGAMEHYRRITEAGHKTTLHAAARATIQKHGKSYIDLAYMRYLKAFESGRISGYPCKREEFAVRGKDESHPSSIYSRFRVIEKMNIEPDMEIENGKIVEIKWNGIIFAKRTDGYSWTTTPQAMAPAIILKKD